MRRFHGTGETIVSQRFHRTVDMDTDSKFTVKASYEANSPTFPTSEDQLYGEGIETPMIVSTNLFQGEHSHSVQPAMTM